MIKEMDIIEFKPFRIEDKPLIDGFFKIHHYEQIDCTFNTLFLWQKAHETMWAVEDDILFIRAGKGKDMFFLPPFAHKEENFVHGLDLIHEELDKAGMEFRLKSASRWVTEQIERLCPGKYDFIEDRDNEEYVPHGGHDYAARQEAPNEEEPPEFLPPSVFRLSV